MPFADVNGLRIHYHTAGDGGAGLVFAHGYGGSVARWRPQFDAFSDDFGIMAADHWGHGDSDAPVDPTRYDVERTAGDILALADVVGLERFHLVGHSLGGAVAQEIALCAPDRLLSLTLADTTDWFGDHGELDAKELIELEAKPWAVFAWEALLRWPGTAGRARSIGVRTLIVHGDGDAPKILEGSRRLAAMIAGAEHVEIPGAGHSPHLEQPERFNAVLRRFLTAHA
jgi:pimeloyl-ACP methyl ester carboxylesterase